MTPRVAVVGANGFLGGEAVRLLAQHPGFELTLRMAGRSAGQRLSDVRPSLRGPADGPLVAFDADVVAEQADVAVLGLPHGASAAAGAALLERGVKVIDLGSDFRLQLPADHQRYYGNPPGAPEWLDAAFYGLPEITGYAPAKTKLVANPGCFATALSLLLHPLCEVLSSDDTVHIFGVTGSTGSGVTPKPSTLHATRVSSFTAYKPLAHQHLGEVRQLLGERGVVPEILFVPHSLPAPRGIHLTAVVPRSALGTDPFTLYERAYADAPLVDVQRGPVPMGAVQGSVRTLLGVTEADDQVVIYAAIDNLLKGGSGQAVQNLNGWFGLDPLAGLPVLGAWP